MEIDAEIGILLDTRYKSLMGVMNDFAVSITPQLQASQSREALAQLDVELPNIVSAVDSLLDMGIADDDRLACLHLISLIVYIERYFTIRGLWEAKLRWSMALLEPSAHAAPKLTHVLFNVVGTAYSEMGNYEKAVELYQLAIKYADLAGEPDLTRVYGNLGVAYWRLGRLDEALVYTRRLWEAEKKAGNLYETAVALANLAEIHLEYGDTEGGLLAAFDALKLANQIGDVVLEAEFMALTAKHMVARGLLHEAVPVYKTAIVLLNELDDEPTLGLTLLNYGLLQHLLNHNIDAVQLVQASLEIFERYGMTEEIENARTMLAGLKIE
jgi:tetratricopeptide (TPR) repeat protein